jgi:hypothetical protein
MAHARILCKVTGLPHLFFTVLAHLCWSRNNKANAPAPAMGAFVLSPQKCDHIDHVVQQQRATGETFSESISHCDLSR